THINYQELKGGSVAFRGSNGRITGKGKIKAGRLDFEDVYYVEELKHYNLFFVSQMCNKKNKVLFIDTDYLVLSSDFKLPDENQTTDCKTSEKPVSQVEQIFQEELEKLKRQEKEAKDAVWKEATHDSPNGNTNSTNLLNAVSAPVSVVGPSSALNDDKPSYPDDPLMPHHEDIYASPSAGIFTDSSYDVEGVVTDFNNLETTVTVSPTPTTRIHTIHSKTQILRDPLLAVQIRSKVHKNSETHALQEEGIDYDEVFAHVDRIKAIRIFLSFAFYMGFIVYQMDVKSAFIYGTIDEEVYVTQPPGFVDPNVKTASTPIETQKPLVKEEEAADVDVHLYRRLISWQCKKQTNVANSTTEAEYVVAAYYCGQVLWIQNQLLDYGFNLINTKIYIDNESIICIVKNPVFHSKTKHIEIWHHFIRDAYEKKLIQVLKIYTDDNVADLLKKAFDVSSFQLNVVGQKLQEVTLDLKSSC
nr:putative ribonuclease H-like domain-containing protein [Tanacetum cinerariifolium]